MTRGTSNHHPGTQQEPRVFVADGDPEGVRLVDRMNWTGVGVVFPRERWQAARSRAELSRTGVYILVGYKEGDEESIQNRGVLLGLV